VSEPALTGGCGCGAVRFEISEPLVSARYCHCTRCQRRTGTSASASASVVPGSFRVVQGEDRMRAWKPEDGHEKWFCGDCGSALYTVNPHDRSQLGVRLGAVDGDPGVRPSVHQFVAYAAPWEQIPDDGLPRYPERRPPD
jgi:hypothetical protein